MFFKFIIFRESLFTLATLVWFFTSVSHHVLRLPAWQKALAYWLHWCVYSLMDQNEITFQTNFSLDTWCEPQTKIVQVTYLNHFISFSFFANNIWSYPLYCTHNEIRLTITIDLYKLSLGRFRNHFKTSGMIRINNSVSTLLFRWDQIISTAISSVPKN